MNEYNVGGGFIRPPPIGLQFPSHEGNQFHKNYILIYFILFYFLLIIFLSSMPKLYGVAVLDDAHVRLQDFELFVVQLFHTCHLFLHAELYFLYQLPFGRHLLLVPLLLLFGGFPLVLDRLFRPYYCLLLFFEGANGLCVSRNLLIHLILKCL